MPRRVVLRLAFDGSTFHGTQRQPEVPTVNQAVLDALDDAGLLAKDPHLRAQGRVDSGVSARDHPVALDITGTLEAAARAIAGTTRGIVPWAGAEVHDGYDPRFAARSRTYRYHLAEDPSLDADRLAQAWRRFAGHHEWTEFARVDPSVRAQPTRRRITRTAAWRRGQGHVLAVTAPTFLRHQVRRMVAACTKVARGELELERVEAALAGEPLVNHGKAAPEGLILWRVGLSADWRPLPEAHTLATRRLQERAARLRQRMLAAETAMRPGDAGRS